MKKIYFILLFSHLFVFSQKITSRNDLDLIAYDKKNSKIYLYEKIGNKFQREGESKKVSLKSLKVDFDIYDLHKLKPEKESDYINNINHLQKEVHLYDDMRIKKESVFISVNPYVAMLQNVYFYYKLKNGTYKREKTSEGFFRPKYFTKVILKIARKKFITLFYKQGSYGKEFLTFCHLSFPDKEVLLGTTFNNISIITNNNITQQEFEKYTNDDKYRAKYFFRSIKNDKKGKYRLINKRQKFDILKKTYDSIKFKTQMIVIYSGDNVEIYNPNFKKQIYQKPQKIYFKNQGYEILTDTDAFCMHQEGYKVSELTYSTPSFICGTGVYTDERRIENSDKSDFKYKIVLEDDLNYNYGENMDRLIYLKGLPKEVDSISFLNRKQKYYWYGNNIYLGIHKGYPDKVLVYKGDKMGLYSYNLKEKKEFTPKEQPKEEIRDGVIYINEIIETSHFKYFLTLKEEIPIDSHKILFDRYDGVIKISTEKDFTFLFDKNPRTYSKVKKKTLSFYEVHKNGKIGFLDVIENKEYGF